MTESQVWLVVGIFGVGVFLVLVVLLGSYNALVRARNRLEQAFSSIGILLMRRHDVIPNLVATVQRAATVEHDVLADVIAMRKGLINRSPTDRQRLADEATLSTALAQVNVLAEAYPTLQANQGFARLQTTLQDTEDQIAAARRACAGRYSAL